MRRLPVTISRKARAMLWDRRAVSSVEFALVLPLFGLLYVGGVTTSQFIGVERKVTLLARTLADLVTKSDDVTNAELSSYGGLASVILSPAPPKGAVMTVIAVRTDENLVSTVEWSHRSYGSGSSSGGGSAPPTGSVYSLPDGLASRAGQTIVTTVAYPYTPMFGAALTGTLDLDETVYLKPRSGKCVRNVDVASANCGGRTSKS